MRAGRTLQPEQRIAHYRVVGPLGAGGMGEVYLAQDLTLERSIALKVLPPELTRSAERVRRFVQEARSASSLNHPNIVTIHEIGEAPVRMADGDQVTAEPLQYIAMELVHGRTLAARIHQDRTDLRTLLGWLAQAADGIAKAHAAGIVHRDLKPSNIMVSEDGFAKVLDFGLAKLVEPRGGAPGESTAPTQTDHATGEGMLLGTVGYMSPEQVQGKPVDARSDVFSFGCILSEAATRKRPFASESSVETLHRILHDKPAPIEALAPGVPAELRRVIRRCLAKNPEQRLQSMKDLSIELHEIADEFETLSASASSGSGDSAIATAVRRGPGAAMLAAAAVVTVAAIAFGGWAWWRAAHAVREASAATVRAWPQTSDGEVTDCALSRDGRFLAYIRGIAGNSSLHVRQVATGSDVVVVPPSALPLDFVTFSPDGDHVLFCRRRADAPSYRALEEAPSMGGPERERAFDVDSRVSFSPDGKRICFRRFDQRAAVTRIIVRELDSGQERVLAAVHEPTTVPGPPVWSPDGRDVAVLEQTLPIYAAVIAEYGAESGARREIFRRPGSFFHDLTWLPGGRELAVAGTDPHVSPGNQVFLVSVADGALRPLTNDTSDYYSLTTAAAETALAVVRGSAIANVWMADAATGDAQKITSATTAEASTWDATPGDDGSVVYSSMQDQVVGLWYLPAAGGVPRRISTPPGWAVTPYRVGEQVVYFGYDLQGGGHVYRVVPNGGDSERLTSGHGEQVLAASSHGGYFIYALADSAKGLWSMPVTGGVPRLISGAAVSGWVSPSPDGAHVAVYEPEAGPDGRTRSMIRVLPAAGGTPVASLFLPQGSQCQLGNDALFYCDLADSAHNVVRRGLDGGAPVRVTSFHDGIVNNVLLSPDGEHLAVQRRIGNRTSAWIVDSRTGSAIQVRGVDAPDIFRINWSPDGRHLALSAGIESDDAVILRGIL